MVTSSGGRINSFFFFLKYRRDSCVLSEGSGSGRRLMAED